MYVVKYALHGNRHPEDHYVQFTQDADQVMVWAGLTRAGVVLGPHFAERNLDTNIDYYVLYVTMLSREIFRLI